MTILPPKKDINAVLMLYWGWADLLQHVGMVRYYKEQYKSVSLVCLPHQKIFLEALYPDFNLFFVSCPDGVSSKDIDKLSKKLFDEDYLFLNEGKMTFSSQAFLVMQARGDAYMLAPLPSFVFFLTLLDEHIFYKTENIIFDH